MIAERDSLQQSFTELRKNVSTYEMATVGKEIAQWNADLAKAKYWNDTIWDIYWPDEIMYVEPIK
jgi:hypothetical protein